MTYTELLQAAARGEKVPRAEFIRCIETEGGKLIKRNKRMVQYDMPDDSFWEIWIRHAWHYKPPYGDGDITVELEG